MIVVNGVIKVAAGAIDVVLDAIATMEAESLKERGCQVYAFSVDLSDATTVRITERWDTKDDLLQHFTLPHMADFQAALAAVEIQSMDVKFFDATESDIQI